MITGVVAFPIQICFTYFFGLKGALIGYGANFIVLWILNIYSVRKVAKHNDVKIYYVAALSVWKLLIKFSLPALMSGILVTPVIWYCNTLLVNQENGYDQMAIFDAANQWMAIIMFIPAAVSQVTLPILSKYSHESSKFNKVFKVNLVLNIGITAFVAIIISIVSPMIMNLYGKDFTVGSTVLMLLAIASIFISANNIIGKVIASKSKMWVGFFLNLLWAIVHITTAHYFINIGMGAHGLALTFVLSYIFHSITQFIFIRNL